MPPKKKQKLTKEEKARRKLKTHTTKTYSENKCKFNYTRQEDGMLNQHQNFNRFNNIFSQKHFLEQLDKAFE